jgi:hypothetical protein
MLNVPHIKNTRGNSVTKAYIEHSAVELLGFQIVDASHERSEDIWVGTNNGISGSWLTSSDVRHLADALNKMADAHDARLSAKD